jgi:5-formyltetrahydrofolate cyclo-ligase
VSRLSAHRLKQAKRALRREVLGRRDALPAEERARAARRIVDRLLGLPELGDAETVMVFWSFGSEVDTGPLIDRLHRSGVRVALPRIEDGDIAAVAYAPGDPVAPTGFGAMEPSGRDAVAPEEVDVVVVPGVAFDRAGGRVGYGGGFYDRFLARTRPQVPAIAIGFGVQVVEEVPGGGGDRRVDAIVTEDEVIRCRPR